MMFKLVFGRGPKDHIVLFQGTFEQCKTKRQLSGDLILDPKGNVVQGFSWLWISEVRDRNCYARRVQRRGWNH